MADFPASIKPSLTGGYSFSAPNNVAPQSVAGGVTLQARDYRTGTVTFNISLSLTPDGLQTFQEFYTYTIFSGSGKFNIDLDSGRGVESHVAQIENGSLNFDGSKAPTWHVNFNLVAETTPIQNGDE